MTEELTIEQRRAIIREHQKAIDAKNEKEREAIREERRLKNAQLLDAVMNVSYSATKGSTSGQILGELLFCYPDSGV